MKPAAVVLDAARTLARFCLDAMHADAGVLPGAPKTSSSRQPQPQAQNTHLAFSRATAPPSPRCAHICDRALPPIAHKSCAQPSLSALQSPRWRQCPSARSKARKTAQRAPQPTHTSRGWACQATDARLLRPAASSAKLQLERYFEAPRKTREPPTDVNRHAV